MTTEERTEIKDNIKEYLDIAFEIVEENFKVAKDFEKESLVVMVAELVQTEKSYM